MVENHNLDWVAYLPIIVHSLNSQLHSMLNVSPYEFIFNVKPWKHFHDVHQILESNYADGIYGPIVSHDDIFEDPVIHEDLSANPNNTEASRLIVPYIQRTSNEIPIISENPNPSPNFINPLAPVTNNYPRPLSPASNPPEANIIENCIADNHISDSPNVTATSILSVRRKANAYQRRRIQLMKESYDKKVQEQTFAIGDIVGICLSDKEKKVLPQSLRLSNIPARVVFVESVTEHQSHTRYHLRTSTHLITPYFTSEVLILLAGDELTYPDLFSIDLCDITYSLFARLIDLLYVEKPDCLSYHFLSTLDVVV
jgi:hypothetical protein